jgi:DNA-directed RNA polymerase subunit RPC12/RpoP
LSYEIDNKRYIKCPHCSSKNIIKIKETDDLREVIKERVYKREHGALRQVR